MKLSVAPNRLLQKRIALPVDSRSLLRTAALPSSSKQSTSWALEIDATTSWPMHSLKESSMARMWNQRPLASWPDQGIDRPMLVRSGRRDHWNPRPPQPLAPLGTDLQARRSTRVFGSPPSPRASICGVASGIGGRGSAGPARAVVHQRPVAALRRRTAPGHRLVPLAGGRLAVR